MARSIGARVVGVAEDEGGAGAAQRLVGGGGDDRRGTDGGGVLPGRDEPRDVRHVRHQDRVDAARDLPRAGEVVLPRVGRRADDDDLGAHLARDGGHGVVVDALRLAVDAVGGEVEPLAGHVDLEAVRQVAAVAELQPQRHIARVHQREVGGEVGLAARVRLHVGVVGAEQRLHALDGERLDLVDEVAAAVVALAGVALGVLVGQDRADRGQDGRAGVVLRRDHLQGLALAPGLAADGGGDIGIGGGQQIGRRRLDHGAPCARARGHDLGDGVPGRRGASLWAAPSIGNAA